MKQTFTFTNTYSVSHATMVYYNRTPTTFLKVEFIKQNDLYLLAQRTCNQVQK